MRLVISLLFLGFVSCHAAPSKKTPPPREVDVLTLEQSEVRETAEYLGNLISRKSVTILPQVSGYVRKINVRPGDKVTSGALLIEIDARTESAALQSIQAQGRSAESNSELAKQTLERTKSLYQEGLVSAQELEQAEAAAKSAEAAKRSASAQISQGEVQLQYYAVRAPLPGTVGDVLVRIGDYVTASTVITSIAQADVLEVSVGIPAERARQVKPDTLLELLNSDGDILLSAKVYFIAPLAEEQTQLVDIKAVFSNTAHLRPSELIRTRVIYNVSQALQIPEQAVIRQSGQPFVFLVQEKNNKTVVIRTPVKLGPLGLQSYVVESGLQAGDRIAVSSLQALRDGLEIKAKQVQSVR